MALLVCDIDNFKNINDTYSHLKGDEVISCIGKYLKKVFQGNNAVYNSDIEFDVLFKKTHEVLYDVKKNGKNFYKIYKENSNKS